MDKEWITKGLGVSVDDIESTDRESAVLEALNKTNISNLDWRFVAARLKLEEIYEEASDMPYGQFVVDAVYNKIYDDKLVESYTVDELSSMEDFINDDYDLGFDYAGVNLLYNRYLMRKDGKLYERPQHMFMSLALMLAIPQPKETRLQFAVTAYKMLASRKISLATPLLLNLRRRKGNLASCFITQMDDSLDSIYYTLTQAAQISKNAGGVGINLSRVRAKGATIKHVKGA